MSINSSDDRHDADSSGNEFARLLQESYKQSSTKRYNMGDRVRGEILVLGKDDVFVSLDSHKDGVIRRCDLVDEAGAALKCKVGDKVDFYIVQVKGGEIRLSTKPTARNLASDLYEAYRMRAAVEGRVTEAVEGGFRVQLKGKLAFCPMSQMDSKRIESPEPFVGQRFDFRITKFEEGGRNIVVSRRQLLDDERKVSTTAFLEGKKPGDVIAGRVSRLEKFGAFIELAPGLDGMAHISELSWSRINDPSEVLSVGQNVSVKILKVEPHEKGGVRISLSIKQAGAEPWDQLPAELAPGHLVEGRVTRCMKFGAFVELAPGVEGLIPLAEMSYTKRAMHGDDVVKAGDQVNVVIKEIDPAQRRITLSLKEAGTDPWTLVSHKYPVGTIVKGIVERREAYGLFVKLEDGVTGLLPRSKALESEDFPFDSLKINDEVTIQIAELRMDERRISLQPPREGGADDWRGYSAQNSEQSATNFGGSLADKLKAALEKKK